MGITTKGNFGHVGIFLHKAVEPQTLSTIDVAVAREGKWGKLETLPCISPPPPPPPPPLADLRREGASIYDVRT